MKHSAVSVFDVEAGPYPERSDAPVTVKDNVWYVHFLSRHQPTATLTGVQPPKTAKLLRTGQAATWKEDGDRVVLTLPGRTTNGSRRSGGSDVVKKILFRRSKACGTGVLVCASAAPAIFLPQGSSGNPIVLPPDR